MMSRATHQPTRRVADSACELREIRRVQSESSQRPTVVQETRVEEPRLEEEDRTVRITTARAPEDTTRMERVQVFHPPSTEFQVMTSSMLDDLKARLRAAEARESKVGSGIRERPTPEQGLPSMMHDTVIGASPFPDEPKTQLDLPAELDVDVEIEAARTLDEWAQMLASPVEIEVSLAPMSESNFYGGFDEEFPDGVFVATYEPVPADTPVYAVVHLPGGYRFRTPALVEFVREHEAAGPDAPAGVGLRMCGLDGRMRRLIREFAKRRPPMFYIG